MNFISAVVEFQHSIDVLLGADSPPARALRQNKINTHRKLREKIKRGTIAGLTYTYLDGNTKSIKSDEEDIFRILAIQPFIDHMQNVTGPRDIVPLDISKFTCDDFEDYFQFEYDEDAPDVYNRAIARDNMMHDYRCHVLYKKFHHKLKAMRTGPMAGTTRLSRTMRSRLKQEKDAARIIQRIWKYHLNNRRMKDTAATIIQGAWGDHLSRKKDVVVTPQSPPDHATLPSSVLGHHTGHTIASLTPSTLTAAVFGSFTAIFATVDDVKGHIPSITLLQANENEDCLVPNTDITSDLPPPEPPPTTRKNISFVQDIGEDGYERTNWGRICLQEGGMVCTVDETNVGELQDIPGTAYGGYRVERWWIVVDSVAMTCLLVFWVPLLLLVYAIIRGVYSHSLSRGAHATSNIIARIGLSQSSMVSQQLSGALPLPSIMIPWQFVDTLVDWMASVLVLVSYIHATPDKVIVSANPIHPFGERFYFGLCAENRWMEFGSKHRWMDFCSAIPITCHKTTHNCVDDNSVVHPMMSRLVAVGWGDAIWILHHVMCCFESILSVIDGILTSREMIELTWRIMASRKCFNSQFCLILHADNHASTLECSGTTADVVKMSESDSRVSKYHPNSLLVRKTSITKVLSTLDSEEVVSSNATLEVSSHEISPLPSSIPSDSFGCNKSNSCYPEFESQLQFHCNFSNTTFWLVNGEQYEDNPESDTPIEETYECRECKEEYTTSPTLSLHTVMTAGHKEVTIRHDNTASLSSILCEADIIMKIWGAHIVMVTLGRCYGLTVIHCTTQKMIDLVQTAQQLHAGIATSRLVSILTANSWGV